MADAMLGSDTGQLKATYPETPEFASCCWMKLATFPTEGKSYRLLRRYGRIVKENGEHAPKVFLAHIAA